MSVSKIEVISGLRSVAHALHSTGNDDASVTSLDRLGGEGDSLETRGADLVDSGSIRTGLEASAEGDLPGWGLADTGLDDVSEVDVLNYGGVDVVRRKGVLEGDGTELRGGEGLERAVQAPDRGPGCCNNDNFVTRLRETRC